MAELLTWHKYGASLNGLIRNVANSMAWKHINEKWPKFVNDACNIWLGLALDGVDPFGDLSSYHSTWLVTLLNYNLPPWLVTKCYFIILALIIPNKKFVTSGNLDVYLQLLIEELQVLWKGVQAFDVIIGEKFNLPTVCIWNVHNFPTYGVFANCVTKGHIRCHLVA